MVSDHVKNLFINIPAPHVAWKRVRSNRWTSGFVIVAVMHCIIQTALQLNALSIDTQARYLIGNILAETERKPSFAVLIPRGPLYVCEGIPQGSEALQEYCSTLWSKQIEQKEKGAGKFRAAETVVPFDEAATVFEMMMTMAGGPAPTTPAILNPTPTLAQESHDDGLASGGNQGISAPRGARDPAPTNPAIDLGTPTQGTTSDGSQNAPQTSTGGSDLTSTGGASPTSRGPALRTSTDLATPAPTVPPPSAPTPPADSAPPPSTYTSPPATTAPPGTSSTDIPVVASPEVSTSADAQPTDQLRATSVVEAPLAPSSSVSTDTATSSSTVIPPEVTSAFESTTSTLDSTSVSVTDASSSTFATSAAISTESPFVSTESSILPTESPISTDSVTTPSDQPSSTSPEPTTSATDNTQATTISDAAGSSSQATVGTSAAIPQESQVSRRGMAGKGIGKTHSRREAVIDPIDLGFNMTAVKILGLKPAPVGSVQVTYLGAECVEALTWPHQVLWFNLREDTVFVALQIWVLGISLFAVMLKSVPHVIASLVTHLLFTVWSAFQITAVRDFKSEFNRVISNGACGGVDLLPIYTAMHHRGEIIVLVINCVSLVLFAVISWKISRDFGWVNWRRVGESPLMARVFTNILVLCVLIQMAFFFLVTTAAMWLDQLYNGPIAPFAIHRTIYQIFFTITTIFLVPWLLLGWLAVRREMRRTLSVFLSLSLVFVINWTAMFASEVYRVTFINWLFFAAMTISASALTVAVFIHGVICRINFKYKLSHFLDYQENIADGASAMSEPETTKSISSRGDDIVVGEALNDALADPEMGEIKHASRLPVLTKPPLEKLQKPARVALFKNLLSRRHGRPQSSTSSFASPGWTNTFRRDPRSDSITESKSTPTITHEPSSPSLMIRNPFTSDLDSTHSPSAKSALSSFLAPPNTSPFMGLAALNWSEASTSSPPPSAFVSSLRQRMSTLGSPHYTDSSRDSHADTAGPFDTPIATPRKTLSLLSERGPSAGSGTLDRISMFSETGKEGPSSIFGEIGGLTRKSTLNRSASSGLTPAKKYGFGLK